MIIKQIQVSFHLLIFTCTETFNSEAPANIQSEKPYKYTFISKRNAVCTDEQELQINK